MGLFKQLGRNQIHGDLLKESHMINVWFRLLNFLNNHFHKIGCWLAYYGGKIYYFLFSDTFPFLEEAIKETNQLFLCCTWRCFTRVMRSLAIQPRYLILLWTSSPHTLVSSRYTLIQLIPNLKFILENNFFTIPPENLQRGWTLWENTFILEKLVLEDKQDFSDAQDPQAWGKCRAYSV